MRLEIVQILLTCNVLWFVVIAETQSVFKRQKSAPSHSKPRAMPSSVNKKMTQMAANSGSDGSSGRATPSPQQRLITYNPANKKKGGTRYPPTTTPTTTSTTTTSTLEDFDYEYEIEDGGNLAPSTQQSEFVIPENYTTLYQWEAQLLRNLFEDREYSNKARPAIFSSSAVNVSLELVLLKINELVEIDQEILISGFLKVSWNDHRLKWNPKDFGNIEWIVSDIGYIWLPDLALINSDDVYAITRDNRFPIRLNANGNVLFVPAGKISARCELDLSYFPFDEQLCKYRFESWVYTSDYVELHGVNFSIDRNHFVANPQWSIRETFVRTRIVGYEHYNFSQVDFYILLRRKSLFFLTYTVFPSVIISSLQILSHLLPFTESERINFGTTTLIAFSVFHISVVEQVPKSSEFIPLLALYVDSLMCLIAFSLVECFFIMSWITRVGITVPPPIAWYYLVECFGRFLGLGANGTHWRRQYLRVLFKVQAKQAIRKRKQLLVRKLSMTKLKDQKERLQRLSMHFPGYSKSDIRALGWILDRWGDFASDLLFPFESKANETTPTENGNLKNVDSGISSEPLTRHRHRSSSSASPVRKQQSDVNASFTNRTMNNSEEDRTSPVYNVLVNRPQQRVMFANNFGIPFSLKREDHKQQQAFPKVPIITIDQAPNIAPPPPAFGQQDGDESYDNNLYEAVGAESRYATLPGGHRHNNNRAQQDSFKFFEFGDLGNNNKDDDYQRLRGSQSDYAVVDKRRKLYKEQKRAAKEIQRLQAALDCDQQLKALKIISTDLESISASLASHNLKRECTGVWTTFITSIDRLMSLALLAMFIVAPLYLFIYVPSTASTVTTKAQNLKMSL